MDRHANDSPTGGRELIPSRLHAPLVGCLLIVFYAQAALSWREKAPTFDEHTHLAAGWSYLKTGDFRLNPEHPPLIKGLAALPLLTLSLGAPEYYPGWSESNQSKFAHFFFYEGNDFEGMFWRVRLWLIALASLLGLGIYFWSKYLWGGEGALLSLFLFAFSPNLIAHSAIVGTDYAAAVLGLLSLFAWQRMIENPSWRRTCAAGVASSLLLLSKFSAIIFIPVWLGWWGLSILKPEWFARREGVASLGLRQWALRFGAMGGVFVVLSLLCYGFQLSALRAGLAHFSNHLGQGHHAFFMGEVSDRGWLSYFVVAGLIKTPIPELVLPIAAALLWIRDGRGILPWIFLAVPLAFILLAASLGRVCIGYRYILPMVPIGHVMTGGVLAASRARSSDRSRIPGNRKLAIALLGVVGLWQAVGALRVFPNYLTYFNESVGGPRNGSHWLTDSNLDWGQDLKPLAKWMRETETPWVHLAYFGMADARRYGIKFRRLPGYNGLIEPVESFDKASPAPGVYAISATCLTGQYLGDPDLYALFRAREPDARIGNSFFVYKVK